MNFYMYIIAGANVSTVVLFICIIGNYHDMNPSKLLNISSVIAEKKLVKYNSYVFSFTVFILIPTPNGRGTV